MTLVLFRATDRAAAVAGILALVEHAREHGGSATFEPRTAGEVGKTGLAVEGTPAELEAVRQVLSAVVGLVEVDR